MLHRSGAQFMTDAVQPLAALGTIGAEYANLDQLVRPQCEVDFMQHGDAQPGGADADDGMKRMSARSMRAAFGGGQSFHRRSVAQGLCSVMEWR